MNKKFSTSNPVENEFYNMANQHEIAGRIHFQEEQYNEAIESYQKSLKILEMYCDQFEINDKLTKLTSVYWKMSEAYEALAKHTNCSVLARLFYLISKLHCIYHFSFF